MGNEVELVDDSSRGLTSVAAAARQQQQHQSGLDKGSGEPISVDKSIATRGTAGQLQRVPTEKELADQRLAQPVTTNLQRQSHQSQQQAAPNRNTESLVLMDVEGECCACV